MKALTVQQPWANAVLGGYIPFFMEPFAPKVRGYFLIHAGMSYDYDMEEWLHSTFGLIHNPFARRAHIIGYARLTAVVTRHPVLQNPSRPGHFVFMLTDIKYLQSPPVLAVGRRGFWEVSSRLLERIEVPNYVLKNAL